MRDRALALTVAPDERRAAMIRTKLEAILKDHAPPGAETRMTAVPDGRDGPFRLDVDFAPPARRGGP